jgi:hypothetical protein
MPHYLRSRRAPQVAVALVIGLLATGNVAIFAHAIDYVSYAPTFSPAAHNNGGSGNWTITDPVVPGTPIAFDLTYNIVSQGQPTTNFSQTITFGASTPLKPVGASDPVVTGLVAHMFESVSSNFTDTITITAPSTPGAYQVKIVATGGTVKFGLDKGNGIVISFTVAEATEQCPENVGTLTVHNQCNVLLHQLHPASLTATLAHDGTALSGRVVRFALDGVEVGQATTDSNGLATLTGVDVSTLNVGNHTVQAYYDGDGCEYAPTSGSGNLGVNYLFNGFQQPINADGSSVFGGRTVPVKIKISDYYGTPVPDAAAHVYFAFGTPAVIGTDAEPLASTNGDSGNLMRYDASAGQYIFNWDIAGLTNGTYSVRVDLGEGICGEAHVVQLSLKKKGSK